MSEQLEKKGAIDRHEINPSSPPIIDITFIWTRIEQIWEFLENNGNGKLFLCKGVVTGVMNKRNKVRIKWDE